MAFDFFLFEFFCVAFLGGECEFFCLLAVGDLLVFECDFFVEFFEIFDAFKVGVNFGDGGDEGGTGGPEGDFFFTLFDASDALFFATGLFFGLFHRRKIVFDAHKDWRVGVTIFGVMNDCGVMCAVGGGEGIVAFVAVEYWFDAINTSFVGVGGAGINLNLESEINDDEFFVGVFFGVVSEKDWVADFTSRIHPQSRGVIDEAFVFTLGFC